MEAYILIGQHASSAPELAWRLGLSVATVNRVIASLRSKGVDVASLRRNGRWHYEIREGRTWEELEKDPLLAYTVPAGRTHPPRGKEEDADYDKD